MTKQTMIWQTLSMIIGGMVVNKQLPETKELFKEKVVAEAACVLDYPVCDIEEVFDTTDVTQFGRILGTIYTKKQPVELS